MDAIGRPSARAPARRPLVALAVLVAVSAAAWPGDASNRTFAIRCGPGKGAAYVPPAGLPTVEAAFTRESYRPGDVARLRLFSTARRAAVRLFRAGAENRRLIHRSVMAGAPVTPRLRQGSVRRGEAVWLRIGDWPSGVYFAKLTAAGGRIGYAPFVVRPRRIGLRRVAVVLPTHTWQAYNYRDDDGDSIGDTWYCSGNTALLARPFEHRGVPPVYRWYDQPFLRWLVSTGRGADYLADADLDRIGSAARLRRAYDLIVFPGHHEYVTDAEYRAVTGFRNRGGNLAFLSANNFYWRIVRRGNLMVRTRQWRQLGRPEAGLIGVQYVSSDFGQRRGPWIVRSVRAAPWLFAGTGLARGSRFGSGGIEVDRTTAASPRETRVVAEIPNATRIGVTAQMTYYERRGAKVFAAGAFSLAAASWNPSVQPLLENLWAHLSRP